MTSAAESNLRSPCRACGLLVSDKNGPACLQCPQRLDYVRALGGHLPGDGNPENRTEISTGRGTGEMVISSPQPRRMHKRYVSWTKPEMDFIRQHAHEMTDEQIARELGRSASTVQRQRSRHRITRRGTAKELAIMPTKICKECGNPRPLEEFPFTKQNRDGRGGKCKECKNKYLRDWYKNSIAKPAADPQPIRERETPAPASVTAEVREDKIVITIDCAEIMADLREIINASKKETV